MKIHRWLRGTGERRTACSKRIPLSHLSAFVSQPLKPHTQTAVLSFALGYGRLVATCMCTNEGEETEKQSPSII